MLSKYGLPPYKPIITVYFGTVCHKKQLLTFRACRRAGIHRTSSRLQKPISYLKLKIQTKVNQDSVKPKLMIGSDKMSIVTTSASLAANPLLAVSATSLELTCLLKYLKWLECSLVIVFRQDKICYYLMFCQIRLKNTTDI